MKRGQLRRSTKRLPRGKPLERKTEMRRTTTSSKRPKPDPALEAFRAAVHARARGRCEVRSPVCTGCDEVAHHCKRGNPRVHDPEFGLGSCDPCHVYLHAHPEEAYQRGWLVRRGGT